MVIPFRESQPRRAACYRRGRGESLSGGLAAGTLLGPLVYLAGFEEELTATLSEGYALLMHELIDGARPAPQHHGHLVEGQIMRHVGGERRRHELQPRLRSRGLSAAPLRLLPRGSHDCLTPAPLSRGGRLRSS